MIPLLDARPSIIATPPSWPSRYGSAMEVRPLELGRWHVADWLEQPTMVEPVDPFERRVFHRLQMSPRTAAVDHFGLVEADDRLSQCVVVRIADAAHRWFSAYVGESLGVTNRQVLAAVVAVMHHTLDRRARPQRLLQRVQHQFGVHRARHAPADDAAGEH